MRYTRCFADRYMMKHIYHDYYFGSANKFKFWNVGQGLFYTGSLFGGEFNFVYDCGGSSKIIKSRVCEYMPQNYEEILDLDMTPVDFLDKSGDKEERTRIRTYLGSLKYTPDEMEHPIRELSGGQKAKVLLLRMSLSGANVLILDEPTRNFSPLSGPVIRKMLREFPGAVISISHDRKYIEEVCDKIYQLNPNGLVEMECSALAACAKFRKVTWAMLLFSADTLADPHKYQEREWGKTSISIALELALDAVLSVVEE